MFFNADDYKEFGNCVKTTPFYSGTIYYRNSLKEKKCIHFIKIQETMTEGKKVYLLTFFDSNEKVRMEEVADKQKDFLDMYDDVNEGIFFKLRFVVGTGIFGILIGLGIGYLIW